MKNILHFERKYILVFFWSITLFHMTFGNRSFSEFFVQSRPVKDGAPSEKQSADTLKKGVSIRADEVLFAEKRTQRHSYWDFGIRLEDAVPKKK